MFHRVTHVAQLRGATARRAMATAASKPIGIVMLNMGGPSSLDGEVDGVKPFLTRLFTDKEIIRLGPLQSKLVSVAAAALGGHQQPCAAAYADAV